MKQNLNYYKVAPTSKAPIFSTEQSACFDLFAHLEPGSKIKLYSPSNREVQTTIDSTGIINIKPGDRVLIPSGIIFDIPEKHVVKLYIRSSIAYKVGLNLANQVAIIDSDYFHETFILIHNFSSQTVKISNGDKIAQGELVKNYEYDLSEIMIPPVQKTDRIGGIGSTGK